MRFSSGPAWFVAVTLTGAVMSTVGPVTASIPASSKVTLVAMHVVAGASIIGGLGSMMGRTKNR